MKKTTGKPGRGKQQKSKGGYYFLGLVLAAYLIIFFFKPGEIQQSLMKSGLLGLRLLPAFTFVILFMGLVNYLVSPQTVSKYMGRESGLKGWLLALAMGILSHGPIYIWFSFLKELRDQGMSSGRAAVFLYSRAVKIPLLPVMVYYFGLMFTIVLQCWLIIASLVLGGLIEKLDSPVEP
ncbi:MAG: permease [Deltaproteobacteria bacterium]|nr:permease [Deltaproteobacteria bacterium]